jgi:hypothetical protein
LDDRAPPLHLQVAYFKIDDSINSKAQLWLLIVMQNYDSGIKEKKEFIGWEVDRKAMRSHEKVCKSVKTFIYST